MDCEGRAASTGVLRRSEYRLGLLPVSSSSKVRIVIAGQSGYAERAVHAAQWGVGGRIAVSEWQLGRIKCRATGGCRGTVEGRGGRWGRRIVWNASLRWAGFVRYGDTAGRISARTLGGEEC